MSAPNLNGFNMKTAITALKKADADLKRLFDIYEAPELSLGQNYFWSLCRSIIYQQLSGKVAKTIADRFIALYKNKKYPSPKEVLNTDLKVLRDVGLSRAKAGYMHNIARAFVDDVIQFENFSYMSDDEIKNQLIKIKGIGPWTVEMFLIFTLNRPDIFPATDLGIQKGYQRYYKLKKLPETNDMVKKAERWRPYRSVVTLYLWYAVDGPFEW
ncbi:MAG TPA: DNA-3-methyladenine glycosylase 2 family protein [Candidatus Marinimicrobia bacterium]|nr:DNA-3-methyladenine glycosylase 2 family protein [Candidatus Neomarinimicrobiota bacterium]